MLQDSHDKLLVAASVSETANKSTVCARQTTLMPNVPGFAALMAMIFCPYMELLQDSTKSQYVSVLCGLGYDKVTKQPYYADHDISLNLDAEITTADLELVSLM